MNLFSLIKFQISRLFSSRYKIEGKCLSCGECCKNIVFMVGEETVKTEKQFETLKDYDKKYHHFKISGTKEDGTLLFACKSLDENNKCRDYFFRSISCRNYPKLERKSLFGKNSAYKVYETFETCGYKLGVNKKFKEYLD